jgi:hypothetical protein
MTAFKSVVSISAVIAALAGMNPGAMAQTGSKHLAQVKPAAAALTWTCPFIVVEIAPVSEDTSGRPNAGVMVYRVNGEIVASERVSQREVEQIRALPCHYKQDAQPPLVG